MIRKLNEDEYNKILAGEIFRYFGNDYNEYNSLKTMLKKNNYEDISSTMFKNINPDFVIEYIESAKKYIKMLLKMSSIGSLTCATKEANDVKDIECLENYFNSLGMPIEWEDYPIGYPDSADLEDAKDSYKSSKNFLIKEKAKLSNNI